MTWRFMALGKLASLTSARLAGAGLLFFVNLLLVRSFGSSALAAFALGMAIASLGSSILPRGLHGVASIFAAEYRARENTAVLRAFLNYSRKLILVQGGIAALVAGAIVWQWSEELGRGASAGILFAAAMAPIIASISVNSAVLTGLDRQIEGHLPDTLLRPILVAAGLVGLSLIFPQASIATVLTVIIAATILAGIVQSTIIWRIIKRMPQGGDRCHKEKTRWRRAGLPWTVNSVLWDYYVEVHIILAALLAGVPEVAILHVCFRIRMLAGFGMRAVHSVIMPSAYAANALNDSPRRDHRIGQANLLALFYALAAYLILAIAGKSILALFGPEFSTAHTLLLIVSLTFVVRAFAGPSATILAMCEHHSHVTASLAASFVFSVVLCLLLGPTYGAIGIAIAYLGSTTISALWLWRVCYNMTGIDSSVFSSICNNFRPAENA